MTYVNPASVIAVGVIFPVLGAIAVGLRFWLRGKKKHAIKADDWLCIPALFLVWVEGGLLIAGSATQTFGWHSPSYANPIDFIFDDEPRVELLGKLQTAFDLIHPITLALLKLSIIYFYRRLFVGPVFKWVSNGLIVFVICWAITFFIAIATACGTHIEANWASLGQLKEQCVNTFGILISYAVTDVFADLIIASVPVFMIFRLQMPLSRKFAACAIILMGCLAIACGLTRMVYIIDADDHPLLQSEYVDGILATDDLGVVSFWVFWGYLEIGVAIVVLCLPTLRPLLSIPSVETVIRSIQSKISLHSLRSQGRDKTLPQHSKEVRSPSGDSSNMPTNANISMQPAGVSSHTTISQGSRSASMKDEFGGIRVENTVEVR